MITGSIFENDGEQEVSLPAEAQFPEGVKRVNVRVVGFDRVLSPAENSWGSFFLSEKTVADDFMVERASQEQSGRELF